MKLFKFLGLALLTACIQTDFEDPFPPTFRIENEVADIDFRVSGSYILNAVYTDDSGEPADVAIEWESSDPSVISLNENIATVHQEGLTILTASANGLSDSRAIETLESRGSLIISGFVPQIQNGGNASFRFNYIDANGHTNNSVVAQWSSTNENIATVDQDGTITAVANGMTDITIMLDGIGNVVQVEIVDVVMIDPTISIVSFAEFLSVNEQFQFQADHYDESGNLNTQSITWSSTNSDVLSIDENGLATAISGGSAVIEATSGGITASIEVLVEGDEIVERTGSLMGTGYNIVGDFKLSRDSNGDLILTVENYRPDGPGPYFYLTNQDRNVANGLNLGDASTGGDITINITDLDDTVNLNTFNFLMVWCEPFNVRLGVGEFDN